MKRLIALLGLFAIFLCGCAPAGEPAQVAATTMPVYEFTARLCEGTGITVSQLVTESVSCLHDYALNVRQVKAAEEAELIVISGAGLEGFMEDLLTGKTVADASQGIALLNSCHEHDHKEGGHDHEEDPHIWLSPENAQAMARNIYSSLCTEYPQYQEIFEKNLIALLKDIQALQDYAREQLGSLSSRKIITFHDGFSYLAEAFDLTIVHAIEEEAGAEASAKELIEIIGMVREHEITAIFTEVSGSGSAASIIAAETGAKVYTLDMAMSGDSWLEAMYHNIDTLKEALE